ncbi:transglycosylase SLT domain-containing protein [Paraconexibacter antarcticus]|uniref:Transglycosylase SLT domain-containing protein n=1 Tax=Paraconexibacter antarcticus TaxID=2949664 RepID=A0ABY5DNH8_9ACTN|nr:LysM peptidoglycan-binding domain-containing protein [Paraconexibacter antarcticus]UTI62728.1 transglycosylase SLT domain-containing protein [Paraconexibacter antarcticus]
MKRTIRPAAVLLALTAAALLPASAQAAIHQVAPGESLASIAAADGLSAGALAAANGLGPETQLVADQVLTIPAAGAAPAPAAPATGGTGRGPAPAPSPAAAPPALGGYTVRPGDTLSGLAAGARVPVAQMAQMNGLDPNGVLVAGTVIKLPTGAPAPARSAEPAPAPQVPAAAPAPTSQRVSAGDIAAVASRNGVDAPLASAIAWQESGFNNSMVSSANARGVMQVMPGTWNWVQANLAKRRLDPGSAIDNVGAGVLYLGSLLRETGGDQATAAAAYYQGLGSVRQIGMLPETRRYVDNVLALRGRFGG